MYWTVHALHQCRLFNQERCCSTVTLPSAQTPATAGSTAQRFAGCSMLQRAVRSNLRYNRHAQHMLKTEPAHTARSSSNKPHCCNLPDTKLPSTSSGPATGRAVLISQRKLRPTCPACRLVPPLAVLVVHRHRVHHRRVHRHWVLHHQHRVHQLGVLAVHGWRGCGDDWSHWRGRGRGGGAGWGRHRVGCHCWWGAARQGNSSSSNSSRCMVSVQ
jgi:hypothetical protein